MADANILRPVRVVVQTDEIRPAKVEISTIVDGDMYDGSYSVTPSQQTQTLSTAGKIMAHNITVNPIPSNFGLITWNGSVLTVS